MPKNTYAIMGATGHIGQVIVEELLKKGHRVCAIGRDQVKLDALQDKGAKPISCDFTDESALAEAFKGSDAVFSLIPPFSTVDNLEAEQDKVGHAVQQALSKAKVSRVVNLSSIGAQLSTGTGPILGLSRHEKRLNALPTLNVLHFRPSYFMENVFFYIPLIKSKGMIGSVLKPTLAIPMVATKDVGMKIAGFLHDLRFTNQSVFEFVGPRSITMTEATRIIGKAIGNATLQYVQTSPQEMEKYLRSLGVKSSVSRVFLEMYNAFNEGRIATTQQITPEHRGKTTMEEFAKVFEEVFHSKRAA